MCLLSNRRLLENTKTCHQIEQPQKDNIDDDDEEPRPAPSRKQAIEALNLNVISSNANQMRQKPNRKN